MKTSDEPVVVEQSFDTSIDTVWAAITDVNQMRRWFFENIPEFKPEVGFETRFNVSTGERDFLHVWKIADVTPQRKIVYDWSYDGYPGRGLVTFELSDNNGSTQLTLTNDVLEDFPDDIPEFRRESCLQGWQYFINQRLKEYLSTRSD